MSGIEYTDAMIAELSKCRNDPKYFISNYFKMRPPTKGDVNTKLYPAQERIIDAYHSGRFSISLAARQSGSTTCLTGYALWYALFHFDRTIAILSEKNDCSYNLMRNIMFAYENLPFWFRPRVLEQTKSGVKFDNYCRIACTTIRTAASTLRGHGVNMLMWDGAGWSADKAAREMYKSVVPVLCSSRASKFIIASSGTKLQDLEAPTLFETLWFDAQAGTSRFTPILTVWSDIPGRTERWKHDTIELIGEVQFRREFACEFVSEV